ncbi:MAG: hypothetical protein SZ59_C0001G0077 [candidate division TM6 bacterium GW2011_GWF2_28_16]|nr:MAG: hypothetical protein SZ59_C0001G0077 [candidate division TM6 bacterium GW2011_GWF2_28_16]
MKQNTLLKTIISGLLFSFAFLFIDYLGFLIIFSLIILYKILTKNLSTKKIISYGFIWGIIIFGTHLIWLYELFISKSSCNIYIFFIIYIFLLFYSGALSAIYFYLSNKILLYFKNIYLKILLFFINLYLFFYFIINYYLFFIDKNFGYPFINPLIPLARYKLFLSLINVLSVFGITSSLWDNSNKINLDNFFKNNKIIYVKPVISSFNNNYNANTAGLLVYNELASLNLEQYKNKYKNIILVSPETFFPYFLNLDNKQDILKLWANILPNNSMFLLGSQRECCDNNKTKYFQTVYRVEQGRIIEYYDKKHRVWFVEKNPRLLKNLNLNNILYLDEKNKFSKPKNLNKIFKINNFNIAVYICSELFFLKDIKQECEQNRVKLIFFLVNDSWFLNYFKKNMQNFVYLISNRLNIPILYVGHKEMLLVKPIL